jgi:hypothetical protein
MPKQRNKLGRRGSSLMDLMQLLKTNTGDLSIAEFHASRPARRGSTLGLSSPQGSALSPASSSQYCSGSRSTAEDTGDTGGSAGSKSTSALPCGRLVHPPMMSTSAEDLRFGCTNNRSSRQGSQAPLGMLSINGVDSGVQEAAGTSNSSGSNVSCTITALGTRSSGINRRSIMLGNHGQLQSSPKSPIGYHQKVAGSSSVLRRTWLEEALTKTLTSRSSTDKLDSLKSAPRRGASAI